MGQTCAPESTNEPENLYFNVNDSKLIDLSMGLNTKPTRKSVMDRKVAKYGIYHIVPDVDIPSKIRLQCLFDIDRESVNHCEWSLGVGLISGNLLNKDEYFSLFEQRGPNMFSDFPQLGCMVTYKGYFNEVGMAVFDKISWKRRDILEISYERNALPITEDFTKTQSPVVSDDEFMEEKTSMKESKPFFTVNESNKTTADPNEVSLEETKDIDPSEEAQGEVLPEMSLDGKKTDSHLSKALRNNSSIRAKLSGLARENGDQLSDINSIETMSDNDESDDDIIGENEATPVKLHSRQETESAGPNDHPWEKYTLSISRIPYDQKMRIRQSCVTLPVPIEGPVHFAVFNHGSVNARWEIVG